MKKLTCDEDFLNKYTLVKNHLDINAGFDGCIFEDFGEEYQYVKKHISNHKVWTLIDNNDGWYGIVAGFHFVNSLGYLITEEPWENEDEEYTITDTENEDDEEF